MGDQVKKLGANLFVYYVEISPLAPNGPNYIWAINFQAISFQREVVFSILTQFGL